MLRCQNKIWSVKVCLSSRECFSRDVVLGRLEDPLSPAPLCQPKDISEDGSGSGFACLCTTDLCNNLNNTSLGEDREPLQQQEQQQQQQQQQKLNSSKKFEKNTKQTSALRKDFKSGNYSGPTRELVKCQKASRQEHPLSASCVVFSAEVSPH